MERFLVTGGQGFFGAWIARRLLEEGVPFVLTDRAPNDHILRQVLEPEQLAGLERVYGDISDADFVRRVVLDSGATRIVHLAGLQVPACRENPVLGATVNVLGTLAVFEAAKASKGAVECVVYASSAAVAGPADDYAGDISDAAAHRPRTHYGVFKTANEGNARIYWDDDGIPSVGLRPLSVYGVGREIGITSGPTRAIRAAVLGQDFTIPFSGVTGFNYVADVALDFIECARRHRGGALALNNPGENHEVAEFLRVVEREVPEAKGRVRCEGGPIPVAWNFDESGLRAVLGEVPHTPIETGVRETAARFRTLAERGIIAEA